MELTATQTVVDLFPVIRTLLGLTVAIRSTLVFHETTDLVQLGTTSQDGWAFFSGTSSAAPQIAGVCALLLQANPALTPAEIKDILCKTARSVPNGGSHQSTGGLAGPGAAGSNRHLATGFGLVDAEAAWKEAKARGSN